MAVRDRLLPTEQCGQCDGSKADSAPGPEVLRRGLLLLGGIAAACVGSLGTAALCTVAYPVVLSHALLAFALGLRHAVDCDHLAAIDNVTRQLLNRGEYPVSVGFWFALGHSTIVVVMTSALAGGYSMASQSMQLGDLQASLSLGAAVLSVALLSGIGLLNARVAMGLYAEWRGLRRQSALAQEMAAEDASQDALKTAFSVIPFVRRAFQRVDKPSKMYFVGFLFGLSFDTATQVGLIGLAAMSGTSGRIPPLMVMIFPLCFSCGMCLVDTANGLLMLATYGWANVRPVQKLAYNLLVTAMSATIALIIGTLELLQIIGQQFGFTGPFWDRIQDVDMATMGYMIIGSFIVVFVVASCSSFFVPRMASSDPLLVTA